MAKPRHAGLIVSLCAAGALLAAPVLAAGQVFVPLQYDAATLQMPGTDLTQGGKVKIPSLQPCRADGGQTNAGTFADTSVNATGFPAGQQYTPKGSPVAFQMPSSVTGNNAVCLGLSVPGKDSLTINVPAGNYTDAYFLAAVGNGPALVDVTPVYGGSNGSAITQVFPDWCQDTPQVGNALPPNVSAGWNGGPRVNYDGTTKGQDKLPCGYYTVHIGGLDSSKQLTALQLKLEPAGTAIPDSQSGVKGGGAKQNDHAVLNIMALTLQGTAAAGAALPKTGGGPATAVLGLGLLLAGLALALRPRWARTSAR
jgi:hypothetical protein